MVSLPPRTELSLSVICCTALKRLEAKDMPSGHPSREEAQQRYDEAQQSLMEAYAVAAQGGSPGLTRAQRQVERLSQEFEAARARLNSVPEDEDDGDNTKIMPNPFVVVTIDEDDPDDKRPMIFTKTVRGTTNPIWKEQYKDIPFEMYLTGKRAYEMFQNEDKDYRPHALIFSIYHDDGVPETKKNEPCKTDDSWTRDHPRRTKLIGKAVWEFSDIGRKIGCPGFEKEIEVVEPTTGKKIKDASLTIKAKLCAPRVKHCNCVLKNEIMVEDDESSDCDDDDSTSSPCPTPKKIGRIRTSRRVHGDSCFCDSCRCVSFQKPTRRLTRKKVFCT